MQRLANRVTGRALESSHPTWAVKKDTWEDRKRALDTLPAAHFPTQTLYLLFLCLEYQTLLVKRPTPQFSGLSHTIFLHSPHNLRLSSSLTCGLFTVCLTMHDIYCWWVNESGANAQTSCKDTQGTGKPDDIWTTAMDRKIFRPLGKGSAIDLWCLPWVWHQVGACFTHPLLILYFLGCFPCSYSIQAAGMFLFLKARPSPITALVKTLHDTSSHSE